MTTPLPDGHVEAVCRIGKGELCCSFLVASATMACGKEMPDIAAAIAQRRFLGTMTAMGDNCSGPPDFEEVAHGQEAP